MSDIKIPTVLALSGSLRSPSFTEKILDHLLEGMGEVDVHKFYPHKMNIVHCTIKVLYISVLLNHLLIGLLTMYVSPSFHLGTKLF